MIKISLLVVLLLLLVPWFSVHSGQADKHYHVINVVDGDTFDATDGQIIFRVRVAGMDAPESKQAFGKQATSELTKLIEGKEIVIKSIGRGIVKYNRILGQVFFKGKDISTFMIQQGFAFYYRPQCRDYPENKQLYEYDPQPYVNAEKDARAAKLIIWSDKSMVLPCQFRKDHPYHLERVSH